MFFELCKISSVERTSNREPIHLRLVSLGQFVYNTCLQAFVCHQPVHALGNHPGLSASFVFGRAMPVISGVCPPRMSSTICSITAFMRLSGNIPKNGWLWFSMLFEIPSNGNLARMFSGAILMTALLLSLWRSHTYFITSSRAFFSHQTYG